MRDGLCQILGAFVSALRSDTIKSGGACRDSQADLARQEQALEKLDPLAGEWKRFHADDPLLTFLNTL
jgi:hypothetical protein